METAMILAAGRGERLRPLTNSCPKALCTIQGVPLIEHHVIRLAQANFNHIIINHAYLGGQIRKHLGNGARFGIDISYAPEPPGGLETGGGIFNALPLLGQTPFLTINADIFTNYPFGQCKLPDSSLIHTVLIEKPHHFIKADFGLLKEGYLDNENKCYTFAGIACYHPDVFQRCQPGRYSITPLLRQLTHQKKVTGEVFEGKWFDIGTMERLQEARQKNQLDSVGYRER